MNGKAGFFTSIRHLSNKKALRQTLFAFYTRFFDFKAFFLDFKVKKAGVGSLNMSHFFNGLFHKK